MKLDGEEHLGTLIAANGLANVLSDLGRFEEARSLLRKTLPLTRRALGESNETMLRMRCNYAKAIYLDTGATLTDLREAVTSLEDVARIARRVLGGAHPLAVDIEQPLRGARAALRAREAPPPGSA